MNEEQDDTSACRWVAYELHDGLLQWIVSARMNVDALHSHSAAANPLVQERLSEILGNLESGLEEGRELIGFLEQQDVASDVNFVVGLESFVERIQYEAQECQQTIQTDWATPPWPRLAARTSWNLLRLCQQTLRNAILHAGPCTISIACGWSDTGQLNLQIRDSGCGFEIEDADRPGHFGLASIRHRAKLIGAELTIESTVGSGTTTRVELNATSIET